MYSNQEQTEDEAVKKRDVIRYRLELVVAIMVFLGVTICSCFYVYRAYCERQFMRQKQLKKQKEYERLKEAFEEQSEYLRQLSENEEFLEHELREHEQQIHEDELIFRFG